MRRRRRRNPSVATLAIGLGGVVAGALATYVLVRPKTCSPELIAAGFARRFPTPPPEPIGTALRDAYRVAFIDGCGAAGGSV